jgi:hypothetical protein
VHNPQLFRVICKPYASKLFAYASYKLSSCILLKLLASFHAAYYFLLDLCPILNRAFVFALLHLCIHQTAFIICTSLRTVFPSTFFFRSDNRSRFLRMCFFHSTYLNYNASGFEVRLAGQQPLLSCAGDQDNQNDYYFIIILALL